jgi:hypothetical protein
MLDLVDGFGGVNAVFLVAVFADLLGAFLEGAVFAGGEEERDEEEGPSAGRHSGVKGYKKTEAGEGIPCLRF